MLNGIRQAVEDKSGIRFPAQLSTPANFAYGSRHFDSCNYTVLAMRPAPVAILIFVLALVPAWANMIPGAASTVLGAANRGSLNLSNPTIPLDRVIRGAPPDAIPAIMTPKFLPARSAKFLRDDDVVLGVTSGKTAKAYPLRILVRHEIVNDSIGQKPIVVTFCPLCGTGMVFGARVGSSVLTFGVSGLLFNSDVLMYDHQTGSLWSQLGMQGVSGRYAGRPLEWVVSSQMTWAAWKAKYPDSLVLSTDTGYPMDYRTWPYAQYDRQAGPMYPVTVNQPVLPEKEWVVGIVVNGVAKAYALRSLVKFGTPYVSDRVGNKNVLVGFDPVAQKVQALDADSGAPIPSVRVYWFAWQAFYPRTGLFAK